MSRFPAHQPPPATVVAELMRAGVSWGTAMAMERWKAEEVLELLHARPDSDVPIGLGKIVRRGNL
jgi:hypothetical protein